jgi:hypothetical protein
VSSDTFLRSDISWDEVAQRFEETAKSIRRQRESQNANARVAIGAKPIASPLKREQDFPMLEYFDVSLQDDYFINALQRDLSKLAKDVHGCSSMEMQNVNDRLTSFVRVPRTQRMGTFLKRASKTKWVHALLDASPMSSYT